MEEEQQIQSYASKQDEQSVFSPIKAEMQELMDMRRTYENALLTKNFDLPSDRISIIDTARLLFDNGRRVFNANENLFLSNKIKSLETRNKDITVHQIRMTQLYATHMQPMITSEITEFREGCHLYLSTFNIYLQNHGMGIKTKKNESETNRLYMALRIRHPQFKNSFGIPISPQMEILARALHVHALNEYDNIVNIQSVGTTGAGKTSFAVALATTYACDMTKLGWDWNHNLIINEDKDYVTKLYQTLKQLDIVQLDEAGNQGSSRSTWDMDQQEFMNFLTRLRVRGVTTLVVWPDSKELDKGIASGRSAINITINERGLAIVRGLNRNPYADKKDFVPFAAKTRVALNGMEGQEIMQEFDMLNLLEVPFFKIPPDIWKDYSIRKDNSLKVSNIGRKYKQDRYSAASQFQTKFLLEIPADKLILSAQDVDEFNKREGFQLSFKKIAEHLASSTGKGHWKDIVKYDNTKTDFIDVNVNGYFEVDTIMQRYLERLRAQKKGSDQQAM